MPSSTLRFRAVIAIRGINPYVLVRREQAARLKPDWRKPMPVRIRVNGQPDVPWRINMMPAGGGDSFLYLHGQVRKASGANVGDTVSVMVEFDDAYRGGPTEPMPTWFGDALRRNAIARDNLGQASAQPQEGNPALPGPAQVTAGATAQSSESPARARRGQRAIHGEIVEHENERG